MATNCRRPVFNPEATPLLFQFNKAGVGIHWAESHRETLVEGTMGAADRSGFAKAGSVVRRRIASL